MPHTDSFGTTCDKVRFLLEDSIRRQLVSDVPLCTFLSGGLDSSIITLYAANYCKEKGLPPLNTYSVDMWIMIKTSLKPIFSQILTTILLV